MENIDKELGVAFEAIAAEKRRWIQMLKKNGAVSLPILQVLRGQILLSVAKRSSLSDRSER